MSEYEILDLLASASAEQTTVIAQLVSLHLAMVVGIYYFLHRSGLPMKLAIAALYSLAFAMHLGLLVTQSDLIVGARNDLIAITETGGRLSNLGYAMLNQSRGPLETWVNIVANVSIFSLWFGTIGFLFFWKRPKEA